MPSSFKCTYPKKNMVFLTQKLIIFVHNIHLYFDLKKRKKKNFKNLLLKNDQVLYTHT